ncbi:MAG: 16S rRNA (cytosine(1402)-N(4))-methyltransferase RsmH, partial [Elusimicrobiota bacterium]|nr:16S rRNA (cytosine(1402)-N(4))-methyltransferase RsmH [Elusimicrobiota bacterium]
IIENNDKIFAFEKDEKSFESGIKNFKSEIKNDNLEIFNTSYSEMDKYIPKSFEGKISGILFDLGVSSMQLDEAERGFSFKNDGLLDMRFSKKQVITAKDIVNNYSFEDLKNIFYKYGEERFSARIAKAICEYREKKEILTTKELADLVLNKVTSKEKKHPATRIFQAIRIEVNNELKTFEIGIKKAIKFLKKGGSLVVISFHSLEDRIAKKLFQEAASECICPKNIPICQCKKMKELKIITKKPVYPTESEIQKNYRARSAIMRVAEKI